MFHESENVVNLDGGGEGGGTDERWRWKTKDAAARWDLDDASLVHEHHVLLCRATVPLQNHARRRRGEGHIHTLENKAGSLELTNPPLGIRGPWAMRRSQRKTCLKR